MTSTNGFPLATETPFPNDDDMNSVDDGASGPSSYDGAHISTGALVAILVIVAVVAIIGISTAILFFVAKKREWTVRETLRRSARRVVTALTPRSRSEFPRELKDDHPVPPTPRIRPEDLEKGMAQAQAKKLSEAQKKLRAWGR
jgi:hypothetical protein